MIQELGMLRCEGLDLHVVCSCFLCQSSRRLCYSSDLFLIFLHKGGKPLKS